MPIESADERLFDALTRRFAERWSEALDEAVERMEREAMRRGVEGYEQPVYYRGRRVGKIKRYSDTLLMFLLRANRPEKYRADAPMPNKIPLETQMMIEKYYEAIGKRVRRKGEGMRSSRNG
jgi:hypothetical protein